MNVLINNELKKIKKRTTSEIAQIVAEISKYNTIDFIKNISALMLFPQNQSKSVIFQAMISAALSLPSETKDLTNKMSITTFKRIVDRFERTSISMMADPPEFPFVLPVLYFDNPYVFMGSNSLSPIYLSNLLKVLEANKTKISFKKYMQIKKKIEGLLSLSDGIMKYLNIKFESLRFYPVENKIYIPDKNTLDKYKEKLVLSAEKFENIFGETIDNYVINFETLSEEDIFLLGDPKYIFKPFIKHNNEYVLLDITSILPLVFRIIIKETYELNCVDVIGEYNRLNSLELSKVFFKLGCEELLPKNVEIIAEKDYEEKLFLMGNNGIIISIQLFDDGTDFDFNKYNVNTSCFNRKREFISERISYLTQFMISNDINQQNIFVVITPYTLGRNLSYQLNKDDISRTLILSLYELTAISINEGNNDFFLREYLDSRKRLKNYEKNLFSELNLIALYVNNGYSFYMDDDTDAKEALFLILGEYSSDYILKAYQYEAKRLCKFYNQGKFIEVIQIDKSIFTAPQLLLERVLNIVIINNNSTIWIINKDSTLVDYNIYQWLSGLISYWLSEIISPKNDEYNITIELIIDNSLNYGINQRTIVEDIHSILKYGTAGNLIKIYVTEELCNYFNYQDNSREKNFINYLLDILNKNNNIYYEKSKLEEAFKNPYKRKTISIDSFNCAYMIPTKSEKQYLISKAQENLILDDIGLYLKRTKKYDYGIIEDKEVLRDVVDYLYNRLLDDLKKYNKHNLICYLYETYDRNLGNLFVMQRYYAYNVSCYPEHKNDIENNINEMTKSSVVLRFLIELASSIKDDGNEAISFYDLSIDAALASQIIEWAYTDDLLHYDMINLDIKLLNSNRIGVDRTISNKINMIMKRVLFGKNSVESIEKLRHVREFLPDNIDYSDGFKVAFYEEFGYSFEDYTEVTVTILELFQDNYDELVEIKIDDIKKNIQRDITYDIIKKIVDSLSLEEREEFLNPPLPYSKEDVFPWRFNRRLSLTRKPIVKFKDKYIIGYRTLANSVYFLLDLINEGKLRASSKKMKDYEAKRNNIKGMQFNEQVYNYLSTINPLIVRKNVKKINKKYISDENNNTLGDIDILYISIKKKTIGVIETKKFNISKNYYEIRNEYKEMFDQNNPKCFYNKHKRRVKWIEEHLSDVIEEFNLPKGNWKVKDMFVVDDYIISKKAFNVKVNIHTLRDLSEKSLF